MSGVLRVTVRVFARQREIVGAREVRLELPQGSTIETAWAALAAAHPALADGRPYVRFARNRAYAAADEPLADGDEVACIPPVSGGSDELDPDRDRVTAGRILELARAPLGAGLGHELAARLGTPADGAVVIFEGRTRETPGRPAPGEEAEARRHAGRPVEALEYEVYEPLALEILREIADAAAERFGVERLAIVHAVGEVPLGEVSVIVVACAPHREAAFGAARFAIDETKARAPIWKAERFTDGHVWVGQPPATDPLGLHRDEGDDGHR